MFSGENPSTFAFVWQIEEAQFHFTRFSQPTRYSSHIRIKKQSGRF